MEDLPWEEDPHRDAKEDVCEQWDMLIDSPGAQYIEYVLVQPSYQLTLTSRLYRYLAVPFASSQDRPHIEFTARIRSTEPDIFPNLKAAFVVFHSTGDGITPREPIPGVYFCQGYRYGTVDLYFLSRGLFLFRETGGPVVQDAFADGREIPVTPFPNARDSSHALADRIANYNALSLPPSHCYRPLISRIDHEDELVPGSPHDAAVLEMACWACEKGRERARMCHVQALRVDEVLACANLVSLSFVCRDP